MKAGADQVSDIVELHGTGTVARTQEGTSIHKVAIACDPLYGEADRWDL